MSSAERRCAWLPTTLWLGVLVVILAAWWRCFGGFQLGTYHDDAKYVLLARALAGGQPYGFGIGPAPTMLTDYPFVFPLFLVPFVIAWPAAYARMTVVSLIATLVNVTILYRAWPLLSRNDSRWWAVAVSALYGLAPLTLGHTGLVMCEALFSTFAWAGLVQVERLAQAGPTSPRLPKEGVGRGLLPYVALGFTCALTVFTRFIGVTLVIPVCLRLCTAIGLSWRRIAALLGGALLLILPVLCTDSVSLSDLVPDRYLRVAGKPSSGTYDAVENNAAVRFGRGVQMYAAAGLREALIPIGGGDREREMWHHLGVPDLTPVTGIALSILIIVGLLAAPPQDRVRPAVLWFELLTFAVLLAWPFRTARFIYPLLPFLSFQLLQGLRVIVRGVAAVCGAARAARVADASVAVAVLLLTTVLPYRFAMQGTIPSTHYAPDYRAATVWLREQAPADAVVLAEEWPAVRVHAERAVVATRGIDSADGLMRAVKKYGVSYVLVAPERVWRHDGQRQFSTYAETTFFPLLRAMEERGALEIVYSADAPEHVRVYRVDRARLAAAESHENTKLGKHENGERTCWADC